MRPLSITRAAAATAVCALLTGLGAGPAAAAPGDPMQGWPERHGLAHRDVSVSASGRVFDVLLPEGGYLYYSALEHGYEDDWSETRVLPRSDGGVVTGPENYAVAVVGNLSYVFDGTSWGEPVTIAEGMLDADVVGNADGDAAVLWTGPTGATYLSRLPRGGTWQTVQVTDLPADATLRDVVLNDAGKTTVVWATPSGATSRIMRSTVLAGSTSWSTPQTVGTVNDPAPPNLTLATDGQGRETLVAGNLLFRQATTSTPLAYQFRTSVRAQLATGATGTRVVWPARVDERYEIRTRYIESSWHDEAVLWSHVAPRDPDCDGGIELGVGMVPGGRAYVGVGIRRSDDPQAPCPDIAELVTVSRWDDVLNEVDLGTYTTGGPFQIEANTLGPVVVEFLYEEYWADPMGDRDGYYSMRFFTH